MKKYLSVIPFIGITFSVSCQPFNFENTKLKNWEQWPENNWGFDTTNNGINVLQHTFDNSESSAATISYPVKLDLNKSVTTWQFRVRHGYNPSASNNWAVYLTSDMPAKFIAYSEQNNGFVLGINISGTDDMLKLYKVENGTFKMLLNTGFNWQENVGTSDFAAIRVERGASGNWKLGINETGDFFDLKTIGEITDNSFGYSMFFGIVYHYTSAQDMKLWFDNILIDGSFVYNNRCPEIINLTTPDTSTLQINFSEPLKIDHFSGSKKFRLNNTIYPDSIIQETANRINAYFPRHFDQENTITVKDISGYFNNVLSDTTLNFSWHEAGLYDMLITELMVSPKSGMKYPVEYIEFYNTSGYTINAQNWKVCVNNKCKAFSTVFAPFQYHILCGAEDTGYFQSTVSPVEGLYALPNKEGVVELINNRGELIFYVDYQNNWYRNVYKEDGGWSLAMIDTMYPCIHKDNWAASSDTDGGSPGKQNSTGNEMIFNSPPDLIRASIEGENTIRIYFNTDINKYDLLDINNFTLNQSKKPVKTFVDKTGFSSVCLQFQESFLPGQIYTLEVSSKISDCTGRPLLHTMAEFSVPRTIDSNDVIINEVLFSAGYSGTEFIELYNRSGKTINLDEIILANRENYSGEFTSLTSIEQKGYLLLPGKYITLSNNADHLKNEYFIEDSRCIFNNALPSLPNNESTIIICDRDLQIIDMVHYNADMHFSLLSSTDGISLERINPDAGSNIRENWHSASSVSGYGTPGYQNSQYNVNGESDLNNLNLENEVFSPDNDGYNDVLGINIIPPSEGFLCDLRIYNARGGLVKVICSNILLGSSENNFFWNGENETGNVQKIGMYVVYCRMISQNGDTVELKKACVLAQKLH